MRGAATRATGAGVRRYLATLGYLNSTPDGQFGSATERAVKLFQEANGLSADGVAGSGTLSILVRATLR